MMRSMVDVPTCSSLLAEMDRTSLRMPVELVTIEFCDPGIDPLDLMLSQSANDLRIAGVWFDGSAMIANWYAGASNQAETARFRNGQQLMSTCGESTHPSMRIHGKTGYWDQPLPSAHKTCSKFRKPV